MCGGKGGGRRRKRERKAGIATGWRRRRDTSRGAITRERETGDEGWLPQFPAPLSLSLSLICSLFALLLPPPFLSLSLCLVPCFSTHPLADYACLPSSLVISFSPSIRYPYHRTTPGVDASRVVATGSERSNLPGILRLCFTSFFIQPACLYFSFPAPLPFFFILLLLLLLSHFFPLYASFFLSCGRSTCLHAQSTHASASIRD